MNQYWIVGANWGGRDKYRSFLRRGYWELGWDDEDQPAQAELRDGMRKGDRIAIKRMLGRGATEIAIRAIGIVKEVDSKDRRVYVEWLLQGLDRRVPARGCFASIHGPYSSDDEWVRSAFLV